MRVSEKTQLVFFRKAQALSHPLVCSEVAQIALCQAHEGEALRAHKILVPLLSSQRHLLVFRIPGPLPFLLAAALASHLQYRHLLPARIRFRPSRLVLDVTRPVLARPAPIAPRGC